MAVQSILDSELFSFRKNEEHNNFAMLFILDGWGS